MRRLLITIVFSAFMFSANSQVFVGKVTAALSAFTQDATTAGLDDYTGTLTDFQSPYGYLATGISVGHILVTPSITSNECRKYIVVTVNVTGSNFTVREMENYNAVPFGSACQISETVKGLVPALPVSGSYVTQDIISCVTFYNNMVIDTLTNDVIRGSGAPAGTPDTYEDIYIDYTNDVIYFNDNGVSWTALSGGGTADAVTLNPAFDINGDASNETTVQGALEALRIYGSYANDVEAAAAGTPVPIGGLYFAADDNTLGLPEGTLVSRRN